MFTRNGKLTADSNERSASRTTPEPLTYEWRVSLAHRWLAHHPEQTRPRTDAADARQRGG